jgi:hypothetical protein
MNQIQKREMNLARTKTAFAIHKEDQSDALYIGPEIGTDCRDR